MADIDEAELAELADFRRRLARLSAAAEPRAEIVAAAAGAPRRLAVLSGAFNPPTLAHGALVEAARAAGFDAALFALGCVTLDKEPSGLLLEDRLRLLRALASRDPALGVVAHNRGLYAEQADAIRGALPDLEEVAFVVGMDKLPQIFDARYYDDAEASLAALFARARLLVAERGALDRAAFDEFVRSAPARRHASRIEPLALDPCWRAVSSAEVRARLARGEDAATWLAPEVAGFVRRTGAFGSPSRYAERARRLDALR